MKERMNKIIKTITKSKKNIAITAGTCALVVALAGCGI